MRYKRVFPFGRGIHAAEGLPDKKTVIEILGGKGGNVAIMNNMGIPVPPGFTISTEVCTYFYEHKREYPPELREEVEKALRQVEEIAGHRFGNLEDPLLVSVRSGARASMPGMMDTVLNVGLNDESVVALWDETNDPRFAYDCYRRLIEMYSDVVLGIEKERFDLILSAYKKKYGLVHDTDLVAGDWREIISAYKLIVLKETGKPFPQDPHEQLWGAIGAVFGSWMNPRAKIYRHHHHIPDDWGTTVTVQTMVFGNKGDDCATGVAFTRDPSTGERKLYGEFLVNAQGEDVVAGTRDPQKLVELEKILPQAYRDLAAHMQKLEKHFRDMQDVEFTIEHGTLWMLQTRSGKRTAQAAIKIAVDMAKEGLITKEEAVCRVDPASFDQLFHPVLADPKSTKNMVTEGLPASPGAVYGEVAFSTDEAERLARNGKKVILVRIETSPEDIGGMYAAEGILTARGGMTSHAAVVGRGMGKPCVVGAGKLIIDYDDLSMTVGTVKISQGDTITICGQTGKVFLGKVATVKPGLPKEYHTLMAWEKSFRRMGVRANAETPEDARVARGFGAEGIGLARTEHMFFEGERIVPMREMILADTAEGRRAALAKLLPMQRQDFKEIFEIMVGLPVTIRLLDPPLHEFLPHTEEKIKEVSASMGVDPERLCRRAQELHEFNSMLGFRGCRLGIVYPEIYEMQARAIFEAAYETHYSFKAEKLLEIMVPLVFSRKELDLVKKCIDRVACGFERGYGLHPLYSLGSMIELPRACLTAGKIAQYAEFFSFGTNDLTQTTLGLSRDDAGTFLGAYLEKGVLECDPFSSIDVDGVGKLVRMAVEDGRKTNPNIKLGVCGEHGGDPDSIKFFEEVGLDYVSCSPYRVPIARLAAAQAAIAVKQKK